MEENNNKDKHSQLREIHVNKLNEEAKNNIVSRVIMAIAIVAVILPCLILGGWFWLALIFVLAIIMAYELCRAPQSIEKKFKNIVYVFAFFMMLTLVFYIFLKDLLIEYESFENSEIALNGGSFSYDILRGFKSPQISLTCFSISILFFFLLVFFDKTFTIHDAFYFITMLFTVSLGLQCLIYLRFLPFLYVEPSVENSNIFKYLTSAFLVFYVLLGTTLNDVFAYFCGVLFGRHKFIPRISPKKTWEGFIGGVVFSALISFAFGMLLSYFDHPLLRGYLDIEHWYYILIISLIMPILGTIGDLLFSSIKRAYNIKDFGTILKSHGGILDRFDSIIITSVGVSLIILFITNGFTGLSL